MIIALLIGFTLTPMIVCVPYPQQLVKKYCDNELDFKDTRDFVKFVSKFYNLVIEDSLASNELIGPYFNSGEMLQRCHRDREAIMKLGSIIDSETQDDVCQPGHIDMLADYHKKFIEDGGSQTTSKRSIVSNLFKTYALQVSYICKRNLLDNLHKELTERQVLPIDYNTLTPWLSKKTMSASIDSIVNQLNDFDDLLIPDLSNNDIDKKDVVHLSLEVRQKFNLIGALCNNKIRPIYETTIMPVVKLAKLGYSFSSSALDGQLNALKEDNDAKRIYTATQICEIFSKINIKESKEHGINKYLIDSKIPEIRQQWYPKWPRHSSNSFGPKVDGANGSKLTIMTETESKMTMKPISKSKHIFNKVMQFTTEKGVNNCFRLCKVDNKEGEQSNWTRNPLSVVMKMFDYAVSTTKNHDRPNLLSDVLVFLTSEPNTTNFEQLI